MLSRVAEAVYWMHRYVERAENVARFVHVNLHLLLDAGGHGAGQQWEPLVTTSGDHEDFAERYGEPTEQNVIRFLTFDRDNPNSIISCLRAARENARSVRDTISSNMWNYINRVYLWVVQKSKEDQIDDLQQFYAEVQDANRFLVGLAETTMSHNEAWHFGRLGRLIERADKTARILDVHYYMLLPSVDYVDTPYDSILWTALLKSTSGFEMYRKVHPYIYHENVADFLIFDHYFPRSMHWCVTTAVRSMTSICEDMPTEPEALHEIRTLEGTLNNIDVETVLENGLHEFIDAFQYNLNVVGNQIHRSFFALKDPTSSTNQQMQSQS
jgi:uncharacterized alpha-E superfamily protein